MIEEKIAYAEKLLDPRWKERRLDILKRDDFQCRNCQDQEELHVHHRYYEDFKDPWDYPDECLVTLCDECHHHLHESSFYREFVEDRLNNPSKRQEEMVHIGMILPGVIENAHKAHTAWWS